MSSPKTTIAGLVTAAASFVLFSPETFQHWPLVITLAKFAMAGGLAGIGVYAKDFDTHSTAEQVQNATAAGKTENR